MAYSETRIVMGGLAHIPIIIFIHYLSLGTWHEADIFKIFWPLLSLFVLHSSPNIDILSSFNKDQLINIILINPDAISRLINEEKRAILTKMTNEEMRSILKGVDKVYKLKKAELIDLLLSEAQKDNLKYVTSELQLDTLEFLEKFRSNI